jgi:hypothetical protein
VMPTWLYRDVSLALRIAIVVLAFRAFWGV